MTTTTKPLLALSFSLLAACSTAADKSPAVGSAVQADAATTVTGTWRFLLASSDVAPRLRDRCRQDSGGDTAKSASCFDAIRAQAGKELIRFARDDSGAMMWRSYGETEGGEELFLEMPVELLSDGAHHVTATVAGPARGMQAKDFTEAGVSSMRVEIIDARTIAMVDPGKGRLVYAKE